MTRKALHSRSEDEERKENENCKVAVLWKLLKDLEKIRKQDRDERKAER
jgi:hypothetical protein